MKKKILIGSGVALACVCIGIILFMVFGQKEEAYRVIKVMSLEGIVSVCRENTGDLDAYEGMALQSGDKVHVSGNSNMVIMMDDDKYSYVEENTVFDLQAEGTSSDSKTVISIECGTISFDIQEKLNKNSSYEVNTPNSTMAVRGTVFTVRVERDPSGSYEYISTIILPKGVLSIKLMKDGTIVGDETLLKAGFMGKIGNNTSITEFIEDIGEIDWSELSQETIEILQKISEQGNRKIDIPTEDVTITETKAEGPFNVTFYYQSNVFCTQVVDKEATIQVPTLQPEETGHWDVDFNNPVTSDVIAYWVSE